MIPIQAPMQRRHPVNRSTPTIRRDVPMRNCPNCGHEFDDRSLSSPSCPSCGREFTVSDIGAATINFDAAGAADSDEMPPRSAPTVIEKGPGSLLTPPESGSVAVDGTGM